VRSCPRGFSAIDRSRLRASATATSSSNGFVEQQPLPAYRSTAQPQNSTIAEQKKPWLTGCVHWHRCAKRSGAGVLAEDNAVLEASHDEQRARPAVFPVDVGCRAHGGTMHRPPQKLSAVQRLRSSAAVQCCDRLEAVACLAAARDVSNVGSHCASDTDCNRDSISQPRWTCE